MENVELFLSQKSQFDLVEKIKDKDTKRTSASLFQPSEDGKQEKKFRIGLSKYANKLLPAHPLLVHVLLKANLKSMTVAATLKV